MRVENNLIAVIFIVVVIIVQYMDSNKSTGTNPDQNVKAGIEERGYEIYNVSKNNIFEIMLGYTDDSVFPGTHWDGFPNYRFDQRLNNCYLSPGVSGKSLETFKSNKDMGLFLDVDLSERYNPISDDNGIFPDRRTTVSDHSSDKTVKISESSLPVKIEHQDNGLSVNTREEFQTVKIKEEKTIKLPSEKVEKNI